MSVILKTYIQIRFHIVHWYQTLCIILVPYRKLHKFINSCTRTSNFVQE